MAVFFCFAGIKSWLFGQKWNSDLALDETLKYHQLYSNSLRVFCCSNSSSAIKHMTSKLLLLGRLSTWINYKIKLHKIMNIFVICSSCGISSPTHIRCQMLQRWQNQWPFRHLLMELISDCYDLYNDDEFLFIQHFSFITNLKLLQDLKGHENIHTYTPIHTFI